MVVGVLDNVRFGEKWGNLFEIVGAQWALWFGGGQVWEHNDVFILWQERTTCFERVFFVSLIALLRRRKNIFQFSPSCWASEIWMPLTKSSKNFLPRISILFGKPLFDGFKIDRNAFPCTLPSRCNFFWISFKNIKLTVASSFSSLPRNAVKYSVKIKKENKNKSKSNSFGFYSYIFVCH